MTRLIPYILYLFLIALWRTLLVDVFSIGTAHVYLAALIVVLVALNKDYQTSLWFGFTVGVLYDAPDPAHFGVQMLVLSLLGMATAQTRERFNLESLKSLTLLVMVGVLIFSIPHMLIYGTSGTSEFWGLLFRVTLPSVLYTTAIGWLFFMLQSGRISFHKFKSLF